MAMVNYDQAEIGPLNESMLILFNLLCGGIILNEQKLYKWWELSLLLGCSMICIVGIKIFISKPKISCIEQIKIKRSMSKAVEESEAMNTSYL